MPVSAGEERWRAAARQTAGTPRSAAACNPPEDRHARLLRASAFLQLGDVERAHAILQDLVAEDPRDVVARFDLALLALDYLDRPRLAARHLRRFLELVREGAEVPLQRHIQAELWLERIEAQTSPVGAEDGS